MTSDAPPGRAFYDSVFRSRLFTEHHRVCCNVGYCPRRASTDAVDGRPTAFQTRYPHDVYQLQLYDRLLDVDGQHATRRHDALRILDVGCGAGGGLCELQLLYPQAHVVGLDVSSAALDRCKEVWSAFVREQKQQPQQLQLYQQSCEKMCGLLTHSVDIAVAVQSLQEVQQLERAVR